jgi:biopolymer transport protein ExbD
MTNRFKGPDVEESVACNLIPMIDIMFLLLLFFMLGADMSARELEEVVLPKADQVAQESKVKTEGEGNRTTVNVFHRHSSGGVTDCPAFSSGQVCRDLSHWMIAIRSNYFTLDTIGKALNDEGQLEVEEVQANGKAISKRQVMIRADENAPYGYIQKVIESCANAGIYKIAVGAAKPEPGS